MAFSPNSMKGQTQMTYSIQFENAVLIGHTDGVDVADPSWRSKVAARLRAGTQGVSSNTQVLPNSSWTVPSGTYNPVAVDNLFQNSGSNSSRDTCAKRGHGTRSSPDLTLDRESDWRVPQTWWSTAVPDMPEGNSMDYIGLPYLPFFSNCEGYDSFISISEVRRNAHWWSRISCCVWLPSSRSAGVEFTACACSFLRIIQIATPRALLRQSPSTNTRGIASLRLWRTSASLPSRLSAPQNTRGATRRTTACPYSVTTRRMYVRIARTSRAQGRCHHALCNIAQPYKGAAQPRWFERPGGDVLFSFTKNAFPYSGYVPSASGDPYVMSRLVWTQNIMWDVRGGLTVVRFVY